MSVLGYVFIAVVMMTIIISISLIFVIRHEEKAIDKLSVHKYWQHQTDGSE